MDGNGKSATAKVIEGKKLEITEVSVAEAPQVQYQLYCAMPRRNRLDQLLTQAAEIGVSDIYPVRFARSVAEPEPNDRWQLHLLEGCKQSGNLFLPRVYKSCTLDEALADCREKRAFFGSIADVSSDLLKSNSKDTSPIAFFVGPEGGFTGEEVEKMVAAGVMPLNLGPHVLRLETAAIAGIAVLRRIFLPLLLLSFVTMLFFCGGCREKSPAKHPLMIKAAKYRSAGDHELARLCYRKLIAADPDNAPAHLALATLCDESLDMAIESIYHYDEYLALASPEAPDYSAAAEYRRLAVERFKNGGADPDEVEELRRQNKMLLQQNAFLRRMVKEKADAGKKNSAARR
jgi:16S rRNA (uracil1498-N3)-methyltransferase